MTNKSDFDFDFEADAVAELVLPEKLSGAHDEQIAKILGKHLDVDELWGRIFSICIACYGQGLIDSTIPEVRESLDALAAAGRIKTIEPTEEPQDDAEHE